MCALSFLQRNVNQKIIIITIDHNYLRFTFLIYVSLRFFVQNVSYIVSTEIFMVQKTITYITLLIWCLIHLIPFSFSAVLNALHRRNIL